MHLCCTEKSECKHMYIRTNCQGQPTLPPRPTLFSWVLLNNGDSSGHLTQNYSFVLPICRSLDSKCFPPSLTVKEPCSFRSPPSRFRAPSMTTLRNGWVSSTIMPWVQWTVNLQVPMAFVCIYLHTYVLAMTDRSRNRSGNEMSRWKCSSASKV